MAIAGTTLQTGRISQTLEGGSLRKRIFDLMVANATKDGWVKGWTTERIAKELGSDEHNVVHEMTDSLAKAGLITFRRGRAGIIYSIRLTPIGQGRNYTKAYLKRKGVNKTAEEVLVEAAKIVEEEYTPTYPIIEKLTTMRAHFLAVAKQLEDDAPEIAELLMEKANTPLTPLEEEACRLFQAYINS